MGGTSSLSCHNQHINIQSKNLFDGLLYSTKKEERCSETVWLVSLTMYCGRHPSFQKLLPDIQVCFEFEKRCSFWILKDCQAGGDALQPYLRHFVPDLYAISMTLKKMFRYACFNLSMLRSISSITRSFVICMHKSKVSDQMSNVVIVIFNINLNPFPLQDAMTHIWKSLVAD